MNSCSCLQIKFTINEESRRLGTSYFPNCFWKGYHQALYCQTMFGPFDIKGVSSKNLRNAKIGLPYISWVNLRLSLMCWLEQILFLITKVSFPVDNPVFSCPSNSSNDIEPSTPTKAQGSLPLHGTVWPRHHQKSPTALLWSENNSTLWILHIFRNCISILNIFPESLQGISSRAILCHLSRCTETVFKSAANLRMLQYSPHSHMLCSRRAVKRWVNQKHQ